MLEKLLTEFWFSEKEAKVYLACLELWTAPASSIARHLSENRITIYSILKVLCKRGIATEVSRRKIKYYSVITPESLVKHEEIRFNKLKDALPELSGLMNHYWNKPKIYFYEWIEGLKNLFKDIIVEGDNMQDWEYFYTFLGTKAIDPEFQKYLNTEFVPFRLGYKTKTRAIISWKDISEYSAYNRDNHDSIVIEDEIFEMSNEIVVFWSSKIALLMYSTKELSWIVIESKTLHDALRNIFNVIWKAHKFKN